MKILDPTLRRGMLAEERLVKVARGLRDEAPWVKKVSLARTKLDQVGVDVVVFIDPLEGKKNIKIPIQVKSSVIGLRAYRMKYPSNVKAGVITMVVNANYTDEQIRGTLKIKLERIREDRNDFSDFFDMVKNHFSPIVFSKQHLPNARRIGRGEILKEMHKELRVQ